MYSRPWTGEMIAEGVSLPVMRRMGRPTKHTRISMTPTTVARTRYRAMAVFTWVGPF
jgi:hypothetical protein